MTLPNFESEPFELSDESLEAYDPEQINPWTDEEFGRYQQTRMGNYARPSSRGQTGRQSIAASRRTPQSRYAQTRQTFTARQQHAQRPTPLRRDQPQQHRRPRPWPPRPWPYPQPYPWGGTLIVEEPGRAPDGARESEFVRWVQHALNQVLGLRLPVDGIMHPDTRSAIRTLQEKQGLPVDGIVGPQTERALTDALSGQTSAPQTDTPSGAEPTEPQAAPGAPASDTEPTTSSELFEAWQGEVNRNSRDYIRWVQQALNQIMGLRLAVDGDSGPLTRSAIRSFQQQKGLTVDGKVGPQTEAALIAAGASAPPGSGSVQPTPAQGAGSTPASVPWDQLGFESVKWLQRSLNLPATGNPDNRTMSAIQRLQGNSSNRYVRMGLVGDWTERLLVARGASAAPRSSPTAVGFDCNFDTRPYLSCIQQARWNGQRIAFAVRYYGWYLPNSPGRNLSRGEAEALSQAGIRCVAVFEARAKDANGYQNGLRHAEQAFKLAIQCGQPSGTPIYFAVDYEPSAAERPGVLQYFEGVRDGLKKAQQNAQLNPNGNRYEIGVYANRVALDLCRQQGIVTWFWQSCSTLTADGTNQFRWPGVHLHQVACEKPLCSGCGSRQCEVKVDWNESGGTEGGWTVTPQQHEVNFPVERFNWS